MSLPHINELIVWFDEQTNAVFSSENGHIRFGAAIPPSPGDVEGSRHWSWSTKGLGRKALAAKSYGLAQILKIPLDRYFDDHPYRKGSVWDWCEVNGVMQRCWRSPDTAEASEDMKLSPLSLVEDSEDSGAPIDGYSDVNLGILLGNSPNGQWDGDRRYLVDPNCIATCKLDPASLGHPTTPECLESQCYSNWRLNGHLNPFDIDNNKVVELPTATNPGADNYFSQHDDAGIPYTKARVLKHTITHEVIHVLAGPWHSEVFNCVMYKYSSNWKRDDYLSDWYRSLLRIDNEIW